jgi:hypothetical protein
LGLTLLGSSDKGLDQDFARPPLTRFADPAITHRTHRRPRVSIGLHLGSSESHVGNTAPHEPTLRGFLHRHVPDIGAPFRPGYVFTSRRVVRYRRPPDALWTNSAPYRGCQDRLRCQAFAACCVLQSLQFCRSTRGVAAAGSSSSGIGCSFRVSGPPK